ncbi:unnamed protein product [Durusdinium trenchii]|uniref:Uncharacterized protein n=2 Tax=Durusdinium trenchii TaxID=1381693 RepID=A0ABP0PW05_9DINO
MAFLRRLPMTAARNLCATNRAVSGSGGMPGGLSHIEGELVGFENGDILKPRVKLQSGQLVTAVCDAHVVLRFRQRVPLEELPAGGYRLAQEPMVPEKMNQLRFSPERYDQITRGPNNVGAYAWVSRKLRAAKNQRPSNLPK